MRTIHLTFWCFSLLLLLPGKVFNQENYEEKRRDMVTDQIARRGLFHGATLKAMRKAPRHLFVPEDLRNMAYFDQPLPIGHGQTISQPYIVAYMTAAIHPKPGMKVLEIGTGSGYQAAVLAAIVDQVYTIEIVEELGREAIERFRTLGYDNIHARIGDGYQGWSEHAPFDAVIVTAAPDEIPPPLIEQLKDGGRMIVPVGPPYMAQELQLVRKRGDKTVATSLFPVRFVPFTRH